MITAPVAHTGPRPANAPAWAVFEAGIFWLYLLALAWVPLYFGSNRLLAWGINAVLFGLLVALYEIGLLLTARPHPVAVRRVIAPALLFALVVGWIAFQTVSWTPANWHNPLWALAGTAASGTGVQIDGAISVAPDEGVLGLARLMTIAGAFWLALQLCRSARRAEMLLRSMALIAVGYATLGLVQVLGWPDRLLWVAKEAYTGVLTASFVNRNSYATFAGIGLVACLGLLVESCRRFIGRDASLSSQHRTVWDEAALRRGTVQMVGVFVMFAALLMTGSRAGIASGLASAFALLLIASAMLRARRVMLTSVALICAAGAGVFSLYGGTVLARLASEGGLKARLGVAERTLEAARDVPWTGYGYGSFDLAFALYRDAGMGPLHEHWDKAHNTYAELAFELGFPAAVSLGLLTGWILWTIARNSAGRANPSMVSLVALAASAGVLSHAFVDFSLQMQAIALSWWALLGAGLAQSWSRRIDTRA